jgi:inner membrane protein
MANWIGIGISSFYMLFTIGNKFYVDQVFDKALDHRKIEASRCRASPTIFNNILWSCVAEDKDSYYVGLYSIFDSDPNLHYLNVIPKMDSLHHVLSGTEGYRTLEWFSDGYLAAWPTDSATYLTDLRYGGMTDTIKSHRDLVFNFKVEEKDGSFVFTENREPPQGNIGELFRNFWIRIKGY